MLIPLAGFVAYYDLRYRRIPNLLVLFALAAGLVLNTIFSGPQGTIASIEGFGLAFVPMFLMHLFGAMGAGDVKLFGAIGAVLGVSMVPLAFVVVCDWSGVGRLHNAPSGHCLFHVARSPADLCWDPARLGNATFCYAAGSPSHHSLWRCDYCGQFDYSSCIQKLISGAQARVGFEVGNVRPLTKR